MKGSGKPWSKIVSGGVSAKDDKCVSDWAIQVRSTAGERAPYLACERVEALGSRLRHFGSAKVTLCAWADSKTTDWKKLKFNLVRQFGVNRAKILNGSGWTKCPVKFFQPVRKFVRCHVNEGSVPRMAGRGNRGTLFLISSKFRWNDKFKLQEKEGKEVIPWTCVPRLVDAFVKAMPNAPRFNFFGYAKKIGLFCVNL